MAPPTGAIVTTVNAASPTPAQGTTPAFLPAIVYAVGQKFDRSFNEAACGGAERFRHASGISWQLSLCA